MSSTQIDRIDGISSSVAIKAPCRAATTGNITLSGLQTTDGVVLAAKDRVLVKDQTELTENGIYEVGTGTWTRTKDFNGTRDAVKGTTVRVTDGATNAGTWWELTTIAPVVFETDDIEFITVDIPVTVVQDYLIGTSTTSLMIATGTKVFTTQANRAWGVGTYLIASSLADPTNCMLGYVASYTSTTLTLTVTAIGGSGTLADWNITLSGPRGATGATGDVSATSGSLTITGTASASASLILGEDTDNGSNTITITIPAAVASNKVITWPDATGTPALLGIAQTFTGAQRASETTLTSTSNSIAIDLALNNDFSHTFTEDTTLANPTNVTVGQSGAIRFTQHASSPKTLAFGSHYDFAGGTAPTVTATNSARDTLFYYVRSATQIECSMVNNWS